MLTYLVAFLVSLLIAAVATPLVTRVAHARGLYDMPSEARKVHTRPIPRLGGIAVVTAFFAPLAGLAIYTNRISDLLYADARLMGAFTAGALGIVALGVYDDLRGASARLKLAVQITVAVAMWFAGFRIELLGNPFGAVFQLGWLSLPLTTLWLVGVTNAVNLIDGLDGLASGIALFVSVVLFGASFIDNAVLLCLLSAALGGSLVGFLFFNFNPAKIFLGDSGSMFLGFVLAAISVWTQRNGATAVALLIPMIALGVPLFDTTSSFLRRIARGQNPFRADREHVHHRLLALGLSHRNAVLTLYAVSGVLALGALALLDNDTTRRAIVLSTVAVAVFILVRRIGILQLPGVIQRSTVRHDVVRAAGRTIRDAQTPELAWRAALGVLETLGCEEVRLTLSSERANAERRDHVYRWRLREHQAWRLGELPTEGVLSFPLTEEGVNFGSLALLHPQPSQLNQLLLQSLVDAMIDFCVLDAREQAPVVKLVVDTPALNRQR